MRIFAVIILLSAAVLGGWFLGKKSQTGAAAVTGGRKIAYYQSPMHPWIKSDKPGNCTICGMKLTPVYEGETGFSGGENVVALGSNSINVVNVQTELVTKRALERQIVAAGKIESDETRLRVISAYVDGRIEKLFLNFVGAEVHAGDPLAIFYSPTLLTAQREYLTLLGQTNFTASPALQQQRESLIDGARQRLRRLGLTGEQIQALRLDATTNFTTMITAPISGTIVNRSAFEGQYVKEGDKLFEIADLSRMWFRFNVYEQDLAYVAVGDPVLVKSPALGAKTIEGKIAFIEPTISQETRSARVRVELPNPVIEENGKIRRELFNGMYAEGTISVQTDPVLAVSRSAVLNPGDQPRVYLDHGGGAYERRPVKIGRRGEEFVEILEGVSEGDRVVTSGNLLIDSQAQLSHGVGEESASHQHHTEASGPAPNPPKSSPAPILMTPEQTGAAREFLGRVVFPLSEQLANDNLAGYNELIPHAKTSMSALAAAFGNETLRGSLSRIQTEMAKLKTQSDLAAARASYKDFSAAAVDFYRAISPAIGAAAKIYKCPMYPKPGQTGYWLQAAGPLRNPYFGSEMIDCGTEVK